MDFHRLARIIKKDMTTNVVAKLGSITVSTLFTVALLAGCSTVKQATSPREAVDTNMVPTSAKQDPFIQENIKAMKTELTPPPQSPDYQPVSDDVSPARNRMTAILRQLQPAASAAEPRLISM